MNPRPFTHVIWDWNGTLFNDAWLCMDCMNVLLRKRGLPLLTPERYQEVFDFPVADYYRRVGLDFSRESFETLGSEFMADYERRRLQCGLQDGALETLEAVRGAGLSQSVLSAYREDTLLEILEHFGVRRYFANVAGSDNHYAHGKVDRGREWIRALGIDPARALLIGDTVHDHEVARAMGTACWLLPCGNHAKAKLQQCGVPVFDSLKDLPTGEL